MSKYNLINTLFVFLIVIICLLFLHKEPLYKDKNVKNLITFINSNIDGNSLIQTDYTIDYHYQWISPLIRILTNNNIYFDDSFPFDFKYSKEWLRRKKIIEIVKNNILNENYKTALCSLKKNNINYFISTNKFQIINYNEYIAYKNNKFTVYNLNKIDFCLTI